LRQAESCGCKWGRKNYTSRILKTMRFGGAGDPGHCEADCVFKVMNKVKGLQNLYQICWILSLQDDTFFRVLL